MAAQSYIIIIVIIIIYFVKKVHKTREKDKVNRTHKALRALTVDLNTINGGILPSISVNRAVAASTLLATVSL